MVICGGFKPASPATDDVSVHCISFFFTIMSDVTLRTFIGALFLLEFISDICFEISLY